MSPWPRALVIAIALGGCVADAPPRQAADGGPRADTSAAAPSSAQLVDTSIAPAVAGEAGWDYQLSADADLGGDSQPERIVLTARVEMVRGRPAWDDGQPWQVYVEALDGTRTYVYAQRLQLGSLTMRVSRGEGGQRAGIVLVEHLPDRLSVYEVSYQGPGQSSAVVRFQRDLDPLGDVASPQLP